MGRLARAIRSRGVVIRTAIHVWLFCSLKSSSGLNFYVVAERRIRRTCRRFCSASCSLGCEVAAGPAHAGVKCPRRRLNEVKVSSTPVLSCMSDNASRGRRYQLFRHQI
ncbi:hypothetical protein EDD36DRAFT_260588 [Exophiala viscosa]|uniref:Uncharacterized protein n=1 Tax=Exophiala viscosa TaxID=2486360 RepID=A0AAN6DVC1_9EURO|nr:hypothetical protein EDD36DRAFT_260588 [Exophiala viscosa]